jgi:hypothetical protein
MYESWCPNTASPSSPGARNGAPSGRLGRLSYRLASAPEIAPRSKRSGSGSGCWRRRRLSPPLRGSDPRRRPTTIGHRRGLFEMRVIRGEFAAVAEPADLDEVCSRLLHSEHPRVVDQSEGDPVLAQQLGEVGAEPAPLAHLDGVARPPRQDREEILEHPHPLHGERRWKLE